MNQNFNQQQWLQFASYVCAGAALVAALLLHLLGALLAGLLVYQLVQTLAPPLERHLSDYRARVVVVFVLSTIIIGVLSIAIIVTIQHLRHDAPSIQSLLGRLLHFIDQIRQQVPDTFSEYLPDNTDELQRQANAWIGSHLGQIQGFGHAALRGFTHVLIGMILGACIAVGTIRPIAHRPFATALIERSSCFAAAFRRIVFAQIKISLLNSIFTAIYLLILLPLLGTHLPLAKSLVAFTFIVGLLPVAGNLISNTAIVLVSLSISVPVAIASLAFLVLIHKLEYFLNARIVGREIEASIWELLLAMLVMEAAFGVPGLIAAPIFYAYIKQELIAKQLV